MITWLQTLLQIKKFKRKSKNCLLDAENWIFRLYLSHSLTLFDPEVVRLNSVHYLIMKINNRRELQNTAINHFADIDYKDFMKIYRECTKEPYSFFTIDTTLPANDPLKFRKNMFQSWYVTSADQIKILDRKIAQSEAQ